MNPARFDRAVESLARALPRAGVRAAVVFGSVARGEASDGSDIDLLVMSRPDAEESVLEVVRQIEAEHRVPITVVFGSPSLWELERQFLEGILREGKPIVGKLPKVDLRELDLEPVRLVAFDMKGLSQTQKVRLERELLGYESRKHHGEKVYVSRARGKLAEWGGRKIGRGTVLVPEAAVPQLDRFLRARGAKRIMIPMWIQRP